MKIHSIQTKIMTISLLIAVGTVIASLLISYYTEVHVIKKTTEKYMEQYVAFADQNLNSMLNESKKVVLSIVMAQDIISCHLVGQEEEEAGYEAFLKKKQIKSFLAGFLRQKDYIDDIQLITQNGDIYQAGDNLLLKKDLESDFMQKALSGQEMTLLYEPDEKGLLLTHPVTYQNGTVKGMIVIHLNYHHLVKAYDIEPLNAMSIYLYLPDGQLLFSNREGMEEMGKAGKDKKSDIGYIDWKGKRQYYIRFISDTSKMSMISFMPQELLLKDAEDLKQKFLLIGIFASLAAILAASYLSKRICANICSLSQRMDEVQAGDLSVRMNICSSDEIGNLADTFNIMMEQIEHLMKEVKNKEKMRWEAEQEVLASQIEPHFLYNTIGSLQYVAHIKKEKEMEEVAKSLSSLLRSVLSNRNEYITLWEEKDYINDFITIERFKYGQFFDVTWDVDEDLWVYPIPKLLLQPVVENALIHGLSSREEGGLINIKIYEQDSFVVCKILDNGKGMSEEKLKQVLTHKREKGETGFRSVGISNVFQRIKLIYGERYGGTIYSSEGMFTCVELLLPEREKKS